MIVRELLEMLSNVNLDAEVTASDVYGEGTFVITGMLYAGAHVDLTGENND